MYYPEYGDSTFYEDIYRKKEFNKSKIDAEEYYGQSVEEICSSQEKILQPHQEFLRNYLSDQTPYNGILLFHGVGTGKTCAAISIAEAMKPRLQALGKKVYISTNFQKYILRAKFGARTAASPTALSPGCTAGRGGDPAIENK